MNGYVPNYIEEIKRRLSIVDIIASKISLKKTGRNYKGLCPFHSEKSGSFFVFPETESYYCFGCHETGDAFTFFMKTEGLDFGETLEQLASRAGVTLPAKPRKGGDETEDGSSRRQEKERLLEINNAAATYFSHLLLNSKEGQAARDYLKKRGLSAQTIELFGLGYALESWDALYHYLIGKGRFTPQELIAVGLVGERENKEGYYDRFRGRVIFPIRNRLGEIIAFGGRVLENAPKEAPKYLNSPQTLLFDKSSTLYGLDLAKDNIRRTDQAVIVEGYMDVIVAHQHGYANVVAPLGTALNEKHVVLLKKLTKRIVLALDADTAGQMATLKGIEVAKSAFDTKIVPVPIASALIRFEQQVDAEIKVATLPAGMDPDEVIREGGGRWRELIERALPTVDYYFAAIKASVDLNSARGKSEAVERLAPAIVEVRDRIEREHYIQQLARLTHTTDSVIRAEVNRVIRAETPKIYPTSKPEERGIVVEVGGDGEATPRPEPIKIGSWRELELEDFLLAFLLRYPEGFTTLGVNGLTVAAEDFTRSENRLIFETLLQIKRAGHQSSEIEERLAPELLAHLVALQAYVQAKPSLDDLYSVQEAMQFQLNRVRQHNLRRLFEQGSQLLEEETNLTDETLSQEDAEAEMKLWELINGVAAQLKVYYPKPSPIFKDSRTR
ncbi:MAG: DNA primase [Chloroflexota bacterium]